MAKKARRAKRSKKTRPKATKKARATRRYKPRATSYKKARAVRRYAKGGVKRRRVYNPQTGKIGGRAAHALPRLDALTKKYQEQGLPLEEARQRAKAEMRSNPRGDWRDG